MIGDKPSDIGAGHNAGCRTILLRSGPATHDMTATRPDHVAITMREAANMIKKFRRPAGPQADEPVDETALEEDKDFESEPDEYKVTPLEAEQLAADSFKAEANLHAEEHSVSDRETATVLVDILDQLRRMHKNEMYGEFSIMRLLAGIVQVFVPFCLLVALWLFMSPDRDYNTIFVALGFGVILQTMALTFYIMQGRR
jgi:hypothetical protein